MDSRRWAWPGRSHLQVDKGSCREPTSSRDMMASDSFLPLGNSSKMTGNGDAWNWMRSTSFLRVGGALHQRGVQYSMTARGSSRGQGSGSSVQCKVHKVKRGHRQRRVQTTATCRVPNNSCDHRQRDAGGHTRRQPRAWANVFLEYTHSTD